jgi:hypothetical protein
MFGSVLRAGCLVLGGLAFAFVPASALAQSWFNPFAPPAYNPTIMVFGGLTATPTSFLPIPAALPALAPICGLMRNQGGSRG